MILGFSTQINGKPSFFIEKIWKGLLKDKFNLIAYNRFRTESSICNTIDEWDIPKTSYPKIHTVREDPKGRWKKGNNIDFFINVRKKDMFRFAPVLPVVSTQSVAMSYLYNDIIEISINGRQLHDWKEILQFIHNDGFDNLKDFFDYFYPLIAVTKDNWYEAKIIHWTDFKY
ncbi:hypothetical protein [Flavobacterium gelatinilyticum]|uniref:hypothetical protein n=1 Tax=Flavobacterium gelatinilyticum TaxID=3003260 RepID=UPI002480019B|nr:hypothetical protein [Flavobacterium gelatinilyticum]